MSDPTPKNPALIEVIFELRWHIPAIAPGVRVDPKYKIGLGMLYERLKAKYPYHEQLSSADLPEEIALHTVQHRFRTAKNEWPVVQVGPGIVTLNDVKDHSWSDFSERIKELLDAIEEVFSISEYESLSIVHINAFNLDFSKENVFNFLKEHTKIGITANDELFSDGKVANHPLDIELRASFQSKEPVGMITFRFLKGFREGKEILVLENICSVDKPNVPKGKDETLTWFKSAHELLEEWLFKMVSDKLLRSGEQ
ncbi:TIGR04255 family protein [Fervidobacterium pennivorans subsp. shakshaketiis]|uniref:TIGR04255 family protein n=1 Tax=Fervidobacterium pennivorans TaxID=93466 RepID=UPI00355BFF81